MVVLGLVITAIEGIISDTRHTLRNRDGGKAGTVRESKFSNARHALRNRDGGKAGTASESMISNARHTLFDFDRMYEVSLTQPWSIMIIIIISHIPISANV